MKKFISALVAGAMLAVAAAPALAGPGGPGPGPGWGPGPGPRWHAAPPLACRASAASPRRLGLGAPLLGSR